MRSHFEVTEGRSATYEFEEGHNLMRTPTLMKAVISLGWKQCGVTRTGPHMMCAHPGSQPNFDMVPGNRDWLWRPEGPSEFIK